MASVRDRPPHPVNNPVGSKDTSSDLQACAACALTTSHVSSQVYLNQNVSNFPQNICDLWVTFLIFRVFPPVTFLFLNTTLILNLVRKQVILHDLTRNRTPEVWVVARHNTLSQCFNEWRSTAVHHSDSKCRLRQNKTVQHHNKGTPLTASTFCSSINKRVELTCNRDLERTHGDCSLNSQKKS